LDLEKKKKKKVYYILRFTGREREGRS